MVPQKLDVGSEIEIGWAIGVLVWQVARSPVLYPEFIPLVLKAVHVSVIPRSISQMSKSLSNGIPWDERKHLFKGC